MSSVGTGQMSAVQTGQMTAAETVRLAFAELPGHLAQSGWSTTFWTPSHPTANTASLKAILRLLEA